MSKSNIKKKSIANLSSGGKKNLLLETRIKITPKNIKKYCNLINKVNKKYIFKAIDPLILNGVLE